MANTGRSDGPTLIKSVGTACRIIESLQELDGGRLTEIADHSGVSKSTVYKHLSTLAANDYVVKEDDEYRLGFRFLDIGGYVLSQFPGSNVIKLKLQELAEETNEVAQYMTEECGRTVVLYRESGGNGVPSRTRLGSRMYTHQTASGKAILSQLPRERVEEIVDQYGLPAATDATITDREALFEDLDAVRERGVAYNYGESTKGLYAISAPMLNSDGTVLGACTVSGPSHRMREGVMEEEIKPVLLSIVNEIELNIAHS